MPEVIHGIVRDQHGAPLAEARVYFAGGPVPLPDVAAMTDATGTFQLTAPVPGTYSIQCTLAGGQSDSRSVTVTPSTRATVVFDMTVDG